MINQTALNLQNGVANISNSTSVTNIDHYCAGIKTSSDHKVRFTIIYIWLCIVGSNNKNFYNKGRSICMGQKHSRTYFVGILLWLHFPSSKFIIKQLALDFIALLIHYFSYFQIPGGWLSFRFGCRKVRKVFNQFLNILCHLMTIFLLPDAQLKYGNRISNYNSYSSLCSNSLRCPICVSFLCRNGSWLVLAKCQYILGVSFKKKFCLSIF